MNIKELSAAMRAHVNNHGGATITNGAWQMMLDAADALDAMENMPVVAYRWRFEDEKEERWTLRKSEPVFSSDSDVICESLCVKGAAA